MGYYVVADGGGTKTKFRLLDAEGRTAAETTLPGSNPTAIGVKTAVAVLQKGVEEVARMAGIGLPEIGRGAFFVPVLWRTREVLKGVFPFPAEVRSDTEAALWTALGSSDGLVALSGTGSFVRGRFQGKEVLVGGWGAALGDRGSGYAIGLGLLQAAAEQFDRGQRESPLLGEVERVLGVSSLEQVKSRQAEKGFLAPTQVAGLCPVAAELAERGDERALAVLERAAEDLADQAAACAERLGLSCDAAFPLGVTGGVMGGGGPAWNCCGRALKKQFPRANVFLPRREPIDGAADYMKSLI